jgi:hypothetical protein
MNDMQPRLSGLPDFYDVMLRPAIAPLLFAVLAVCLLARRKPEVWAPDPILPRHEAAALLGYIVAPAVFFLGSLVTKHFVFFPRYGLFCIIGLACGSVVVLFRATGGDGRAGKVALVILVAWLAAARGREAIAMARDPRLGFEGENPLLVRALATGRRVVMIDPVKFLAGDFYLPDAGRLYYVTVDRDTARRYAWQDLLDQLMEREGRDLPLRAHVEPWKSFAGRNPSFLLHVGDPRECLHDVLLRGGWRLSLISHKGTEWLYDVTAPVDGSSR